MFLCGPAGGGYPGRGEPPRPADITAPPAGFTLHPVLRLQALRREEEEEEKEEEEAPEPTRFLHVIAVPALTGTVAGSLHLVRPKETERTQTQQGVKKKKKKKNCKTVTEHSPISTTRRTGCYRNVGISTGGLYSYSVTELLKNPS